jgi:Flp pilus assembly protein TadD
MPVREVLGGALLANGDYAAAEKVFRAEILRQPRNGRALFGLAESLRKQGKDGAAKSVQVEFEKAWQHADTKLTVASLAGLNASPETAGIR